MGKINVLFMQSQTFFGSDSMIHSLIMRNLDRDRINVHVACNRGTARVESDSLRALRAIPDLHVRATDFGPSVNSQTRRKVARDVVRGLPAISSALGLVRYARQNKIDIVHGTEKPRDAYYGWLLARRIGARSITHLHVKVEDWISPRVRRAMHHNDGLLAVSDFVADSAVRMGYERDRTYAVLNSIDLTTWDPATDGNAVRREFDIPDGMPLLAIISRVFPWKGHGNLFRALARVKDSEPGFRLLVVGEDDPRATPGGGSYLSQLHHLRTELELDDHVIFTGFRSDIRQLLAAADIFAMPTFEEPCAVAFLEAMAMAKCVVALRSGGTPQLVDEGSTGLLSEPEDIEALAANVLTLIRDPEMRRRMGQTGRNRVEELFTPTRLANEVEEVYRKVLATPRR
jgi:glycosyltransferase involved in cell wall biosynthesis